MIDTIGPAQLVDFFTAIHEEHSYLHRANDLYHLFPSKERQEVEGITYKPLTLRKIYVLFFKYKKELRNDQENLPLLLEELQRMRQQKEEHMQKKFVLCRLISSFTDRFRNLVDIHQWRTTSTLAERIEKSLSKGLKADPEQDILNDSSEIDCFAQEATKTSYENLSETDTILPQPCIKTVSKLNPERLMPFNTPPPVVPSPYKSSQSPENVSKLLPDEKEKVKTLLTQHININLGHVNKDPVEQTQSKWDATTAKISLNLYCTGKMTPHQAKIFFKEINHVSHLEELLHGLERDEQINFVKDLFKRKTDIQYDLANWLKNSSLLETGLLLSCLKALNDQALNHQNSSKEKQLTYDALVLLLEGYQQQELDDLYIDHPTVQNSMRVLINDGPINKVNQLVAWMCTKEQFTPEIFAAWIHILDQKEQPEKKDGKNPIRETLNQAYPQWHKDLQGFA